MMYTMTIYNVSYDGDPSRDCLNFLHAAWKHAGLFFTKHGKFQDRAWKHFVGLQCSLHYLN